jgi:hypothetical protein
VYLSGNPVCNLRIHIPQLQAACSRRRPQIFLQQAVINATVVGAFSNNLQFNAVRRDLCDQPGSPCAAVRVGPPGLAVPTADQ